MLCKAPLTDTNIESLLIIRLSDRCCNTICNVVKGVLYMVIQYISPVKCEGGAKKMPEFPSSQSQLAP